METNYLIIQLKKVQVPTEPPIEVSNIQVSNMDKPGKGIWNEAFPSNENALKYFVQGMKAHAAMTGVPIDFETIFVDEFSDEPVPVLKKLFS